MPVERREGWELPDVIDPPESMEVTICIPKNVTHMKAFWGALLELTFWNNWQPDPEHKGTLVARVWYRYFLSWQRSMNELPDCEGGMAQCCVPPQITLRINPATGNVEQSPDGGNTWSPAAGGFQSVIVEPVPPVTSGVAATKCDAATNVSGQVQVWIDQVSNDFTTAVTLLDFGLAVIAAVAAAVLTVLTGGALAPVEALALAALGAALTAAWGAGKAVFDAYWTTEIKDQILCAAFCNIGEDGSFSEAQFSAFWNKVNSQLPPSPAKMLFMGFLSSVGKQGLNAMAASGMSADADCEDCVCSIDCVVDDWAVKVFNGTPMGTIDSVGDNYIIGTLTLHPDFGQYVFQIQAPTDSACCVIDSIEVLSGADNTANFYIPCDSPRWPSTELLGIGSFPSLSLNTVHVRDIDNANQVKITFH